MRIISGSRKKMNLYGPDTKDIRPTTDRAKEAIFNIINTEVIDSTFIDLFTGTGSIALEAKSRGASEVYAVDNSSESQKIVQKNIEKSQLPINFIKQSVNSFLKSNQKKADFIFMDPPFNFDNKEIKEIAKHIFDNNNLKVESTVIIERETSPKNEELITFLEDYGVVDLRKYGKVSFIIVRR